MESIFERWPVIISSVIFVIIAILVWSFRRVKAKHLCQQQQKGLLWLQRFRPLLTSIQQHRGLSNGYLNGDIALEQRIKPLQRDIDSQISKLLEPGSWMHGNASWLGISDHWQRLSQNYQTLSPPNNLEQHNCLIASLLNLIEDCAEGHSLLELADNQSRPISYLWNDFLSNAEYIGQARAIGTGVAAASVCSSVNRIRLSYLHNRLTQFIGNHSRSITFTNLPNLLAKIDTDIVKEKPKVKPSEYFETATSALEEVMSEFDSRLKKIQQNLKH